MVPPWPKSIAWYNSEGKIEEKSGGRYHQRADGLGGYIIDVKPTEAADQGEWKCVATSEDGSMSISRCDVKMASKYQRHFSRTFWIGYFQSYSLNWYSWLELKKTLPFIMILNVQISINTFLP